jgi:hypothetical protein
LFRDKEKRGELESCMDHIQKLWTDFYHNIYKKNYKYAVELWEPKTRRVFLKNIQNFRRKQNMWKKVEYIGTTTQEYIIIRYTSPKGIIAKMALAFNRHNSGEKSLCGKILNYFYECGKKIRGKGYGYFFSICGILIKRFDMEIKEFRDTEVIKRYSIIQEGEKKYLGWSYSKSIILSEAEVYEIYEFDTFIFHSAVNYSAHISMLKKLDLHVKSLLDNIKSSIPKINIYFHAKMNTRDTGIPKAFFVAPGSNDICIYNNRVSLNTLKHELHHSIIYSTTLSWPPLFFREGYAESYETNKKGEDFILNNKYPFMFLLKDQLFFDYTEYPPIIAGVLVRYLIKEFGVERFYSVYRYANDMSINESLKLEYGFSFFELIKRVKTDLRNTEN